MRGARCFPPGGFYYDCSDMGVIRVYRRMKLDNSANDCPRSSHQTKLQKETTPASQGSQEVSWREALPWHETIVLVSTFGWDTYRQALGHCFADGLRWALLARNLWGMVRARSVLDIVAVVMEWIVIVTVVGC